MATTKDDIRGWLNEAKARGATHVLVVVDRFSHDDYPVFVLPTEKAGDKADEYNKKEMQRVMECYSLALDWEEQLNEFRAHHYD